jgi:hypothetical protein
MSALLSQPLEQNAVTQKAQELEDQMRKVIEQKAVEKEHELTAAFKQIMHLKEGQHADRIFAVWQGMHEEIFEEM